MGPASDPEDSSSELPSWPPSRIATLNRVASIHGLDNQNWAGDDEFYHKYLKPPTGAEWRISLSATSGGTDDFADGDSQKQILADQAPYNVANDWRVSRKNPRYHSTDDSITPAPLNVRKTQGGKDLTRMGIPEDVALAHNDLTLPARLGLLGSSYKLSPSAYTREKANLRQHPAFRDQGSPGQSFTHASVGAPSLIPPPSSVYEDLDEDREALRKLWPVPENFEMMAMDRSPRVHIPAPPSQLPPDGGPFAWAMVVCGFLAAMCTWGLATAFGTFQAYYQTVLLVDKTPSQLAWIGSIQLFLLFFLGAPVGLAYDHGYWRIPWNGGILILLIGMYVKSVCTKYWQLLVVEGVVTGLGMGLIFSSGIMILMGYFRRKAAIAFSIVTAGASIGMIAFSGIFTGVTYAEYTDFAAASRANAYCATAALVVPLFIVRPWQPSLQQTTNTHVTHSSGITIPWRALIDIPYALSALGIFLAFWGLYFAFYFLQLYALTNLDMHALSILSFVAVLAGCNLVGRIAAGAIATSLDDRNGALLVCAPSTALAGIIMLAWIRVSSRAGLFAIAATYGLFSGGVQALYAPLVRDVARDAACRGRVGGGVRHAGLLSGVAFSFVSFACLTGAPIAGRLLEVGGRDFVAPQGFAGASLLASACVLGGVMVVEWMGARGRG